VGKDPLLCPDCRIGRLLVIADLPRVLPPPRMRPVPRSP
jgi:hypothetical protein